MDFAAQITPAANSVQHRRRTSVTAVPQYPVARNQNYTCDVVVVVAAAGEGGGLRYVATGGGETRARQSRCWPSPGAVT
jgi:hypothetical protein